MTNDKELSSLKLERKECPKCGATWINGKHRWSTGCEGNELDLAGLVCNQLGDETCINPSKGIDGGQTWERRAGYIEGAIESRKKILNDMNDAMEE